MRTFPTRGISNFIKLATAGSVGALIKITSGPIPTSALTDLPVSSIQLSNLTFADHAISAEKHDLHILEFFKKKSAQSARRAISKLYE